MTEYKIGAQALTLIEVVNCPKCGTLNRAPDFAPASLKSQLMCRACFAKPVVMQSYTFLMPIHFYLAVECKQCGFVITLAITPDRLQIETARAALPGFNAICPACQTELEYQPADVVVWSGPQPTPAFVAHPTFVEIHKT
jgi:Zn ribbon nucleic-acid-binding protein